MTQMECWKPGQSLGERLAELEPGFDFMLDGIGRDGHEWQACINRTREGWQVEVCWAPEYFGAKSFELRRLFSHHRFAADFFSDLNGHNREGAAHLHE